MEKKWQESKESLTQQRKNSIMSPNLKHIAIIMDGNGRWASRRGLPRAIGHLKGVKNVRSIVEACREREIELLTLYAFSTENWKRPKREVKTLMKYLEEYLVKEMPTLKKNNIRLSAIGRIEDLPLNVQAKLREVISETSSCNGMVLNLALNYGGRSEIVDAIKKIQAKTQGVEIDEGNFSDFLYTKGLPDPDLLIRTGGEERLSNFLLWQLAYTEIYFTKKLWPDFGKKDLDEAMETFKKKERRFGDIPRRQR